MTKFNSVVKLLLGLASALIALFLGQKFIIYLYSFGIIVTLVFLFVMFGYLIMCFGLYSSKKWAWSAFISIVIVSIFLTWILTFTMPDGKGDLLESFLHCIVFVSLVVISIVAIYFLIRLIVKKMLS